MPSKNPVLFLFSGDEFLRREKIKALLQRLLPEDLKTSNLSRIYPDELDGDAFSQQVRTPSLLGGPQVFWFSQLERAKKESWAFLEPLLEELSREKTPSSFFIFEADVLPKTHVLISLAARFGTYVHLDGQGADRGMEIWRAKLKQAGKQITPPAWQMLIEKLGKESRLLDTCLDQLILYGDGPQITEADVQKLSTEFLRFEPFDLTEALAERNLSKALIIFKYLHELEGDFQNMIGLLHWQLKRLWQAKRLLERGVPPDAIGREIRISPYHLNRFLGQAKRFDQKVIEEFLDKLWRIDWGLKTGAQEGKAAMEIFLASI